MPLDLSGRLSGSCLTQGSIVFAYLQMNMTKNLFALLLAAGLVGAVTGCVETVDGRSQAGVPFIRDKFTSQYERSVPQILSAAKKVLAFNGTLVAENTLNNSLEAKVNQVSVWVRAEAVDTAKPLTKVIVQTRDRAGAADLELAKEIDKQIALQLAAGN